MINKPTPFKGLNVRIPIIIPIEGRGFISQGSGLGEDPSLLEIRDDFVYWLYVDVVPLCPTEPQ